MNKGRYEWEEVEINYDILKDLLSDEEMEQLDELLFKIMLINKHCGNFVVDTIGYKHCLEIIQKKRA